MDSLASALLNIWLKILMNVLITPILCKIPGASDMWQEFLKVFSEIYGK